MSSGTEPDSPRPLDLDFDQAEFDKGAEAKALACVACHRPVVDAYYEINGAVFCENCRQGVEAHLRRGSGVRRFFKATLFGVGAVIVGTILYSLFLTYSPIDVSITAILVGYMVGTMVRKGSENRGGLVFQFLAMFLTYSTLALTYFTVAVIPELKNLAQQQKVAAPNNPPAKPKVGAKGANPANNPGPAVAPEPPEAVGELTFGSLAGVLAILLIAAYVTPVLLATQNPIIIFFVGVALWEAWKFNRKIPLVVTGPYRIGRAGPEGEPGYA